jgi:hypothetical protein
MEAAGLIAIVVVALIFKGVCWSAIIYLRCKRTERLLSISSGDRVQGRVIVVQAPQGNGPYGPGNAGPYTPATFGPYPGHASAPNDLGNVPPQPSVAPGLPPYSPGASAPAEPNAAPPAYAPSASQGGPGYPRHQSGDIDKQTLVENEELQNYY